jgi:hypothetical protein
MSILSTRVSTPVCHFLPDLQSVGFLSDFSFSENYECKLTLLQFPGDQIANGEYFNMLEAFQGSNHTTTSEVSMS